MAEKRGCKDCDSVEEWRPVVGYEERYEVSSHGRVRSAESDYIGARGIRRHREPKLRKLFTDSFGYQWLELSVSRERRYWSVHRLVTLAFHGPPNAGQDSVRHLDHDPGHNHPDNLAWGTRSENIQDSVRDGRHRNGASYRMECPYGHPYDMVDRHGHRRCRTCKRAKDKRYRERRKAIA